MLEADAVQRGVALARVIIEPPLRHVSATPGGDLRGTVGRVGIEHVHVVGPGNGVEAVRQVELLVLCEDQH